MKLGTQTGSLFNHIMANGTINNIVPGETGATLLMWTDRHAATVVEVFKKGKFDYIVIQMDEAKRVDNNGLSDNQSYEYVRNPAGRKEIFKVTDKGFKNVRINGNGRYVQTGVYGLMVGVRREYHDFSF